MLNARPGDVADKTQRTKPRSFDRRKEEILTAAAVLFNRHGLRDATLLVIASNIGLNLKSRRYYVGRRKDLVAAAFMRSIDPHREPAKAALADAGIEAPLRHFVSGYFGLRAAVARGEKPGFVHSGDMLNDGMLDGSVRICNLRIAADLYVRPILNGPARWRDDPTAGKDRA